MTGGRGAPARTGAAVAGTVITLAVVASLVLRQRSIEVAYGLYIVLNAPSAILLLWTGVLVLRRFPRHAAGWILFVTGLIHAAHAAVAAVADVLLVAGGVEAPLVGDHGLVPAELPLGAAIALWVMGWLWVPAAMLAIMLPMVFPDGRLPARCGRVVAGIGMAGAALLATGSAISGWPTAGWATAEEPVVVGVLMLAGGLCSLVVAGAGTATFVVRWRRADSSRRRFQVVGGIATVFAVLAVVTYPWPQVWVPTIIVTLHALVVVYALAILRYRLHDVEPVLGRRALAVTLSLLGIAVQVVVAFGAGLLVGTVSADPALPLVAVAVVALLIEPARRRAGVLIDRWVYGRNTDRGAVLSTLADRANRPDDPPAVPADVAEMVRRGTGADRVEIWLAPDGLAVAAGRPPRSGAPILTLPVAHRDQSFGELRLYAHAASDLAPEAPELVTDVARVLGILLHNERLSAQLAAQLDALAASRRRLVEAQDRARRELERDIHDGAQARLVALRLQVAALRARALGSGDDLIPGLDGLGAGLDEAIRSLRRLARGLRPPILEQSGLATAVRAHVRDLLTRVEVVERGSARYAGPVEGAAYFCCLEAVQNAVRHSGATRIIVLVEHLPAELRIEVRDDGSGFDPARRGAGTGLANLADRVGALDGRVHLDAGPGRGTTVTMTIPSPGQSATAER